MSDHFLHNYGTGSIKRLKKRFRKMIINNINATVDEKVDDAVSQLYNVGFCQDDTIHILIKTSINGGAVLGFLGKKSG